MKLPSTNKGGIAGIFFCGGDDLILSHKFLEQYQNLEI